nr:PHD finger protein MALE MEIOCYTE DEATH 1-like [Ipomoea trifida]
MASTLIEACKTRRRNRRPFRFEEFAMPGTIDGLSGAFRENIRFFLQEFAVLEDYIVAGMPLWSTWFITASNGAVFPLYTIEETVQHSPEPFCDHCKFAGWGHHYVSKRRYHLIVPANANWEKPLTSNCLEIGSHILHGLIHCNGYGHLLCINGVREDSHSLPATHFMDFWDRLCTALKTRKVSVFDVSMKGGMELRLLHGVTYGMSWFGKWGYKFNRGSFGVTEQKYKIAIDYLQSLGLDKILNDFKKSHSGRRKIKQVIDKYREMSENPLITISELLQFKLSLKCRASNQNKTKLAEAYHYCSSKSNAQDNDTNPMSVKTFLNILVKSDCRWPARRLEFVLVVIVNLLKEKKANESSENAGMMTRQELRDGIRKCIGDTGLIDFVLKSIRCFALGTHIVRRTTNPTTKLLEFTIDEAAKETTEVARFPFLDENNECRWDEGRLKQAAEAIVDILKTHNGNGSMSRKELRDKAREHVRDTGLIDFLLKSMNNSVVGNHVVYRSRNSLTKRIEFLIHDFEDSSSGEESIDIYADVKLLYDNVLLGYPGLDSVISATQVILDSKQFVKEWVFQDQENRMESMPLTCQVLPSFDELETELTRPLSPGEVVVVPGCITIGELKKVAQSALRDTYCIMENFVVKQIGGLKGIEDERVLMCTVSSEAHVWVRGCGLDLGTEMRYQDGSQNSKVKCVCGTKEDDGERMVECDACQAWQHTRCCGIDDDEDAPSVFLCGTCGGKW